MKTDTSANTALATQTVQDYWTLYLPQKVWLKIWKKTPETATAVCGTPAICQHCILCEISSKNGTARCENDAILRDCQFFSCFNLPFLFVSFSFDFFFPFLLCFCTMRVVLMKLQSPKFLNQNYQQQQQQQQQQEQQQQQQQQQQQSRPGCIVCHWTSGLLNLRVTCGKFAKWMFLFANKTLTAFIEKNECLVLHGRQSTHFLCDCFRAWSMRGDRSLLLWWSDGPGTKKTPG